METTTPSSARIALRFGLITGLAMIIYSMILNFSGVAYDSALQYFSYVILIAGVVYAVREFKNQNSGYLTLGQGMGAGTLTSAVAGVLASVFSWIYITFVDDSMMKKAFDAQRDALEERGMSEEQINQAMEMGQKFASFGFIFAIIFFVIVGFIAALIAAAIMKKDRDVFAQ